MNLRCLACNGELELIEIVQVPEINHGKKSAIYHCKKCGGLWTSIITKENRLTICADLL